MDKQLTPKNESHFLVKAGKYTFDVRFAKTCQPYLENDPGDIARKASIESALKAAANNPSVASALDAATAASADRNFNYFIVEITCAGGQSKVSKVYASDGTVPAVAWGMFGL